MIPGVRCLGKRAFNFKCRTRKQDVELLCQGPNGLDAFLVSVLVYYVRGGARMIVRTGRSVVLTRHRLHLLTALSTCS